MNQKKLILSLFIACNGTLYPALITHYQEEMTNYANAMQTAQDVIDYLIYHPAISAQDLNVQIDHLSKSFAAASQSLGILEQYYQSDKTKVQRRTELQQKLGVDKKYFASNGKALKMLKEYLSDKKVFAQARFKNKDAKEQKAFSLS